MRKKRVVITGIGPVTGYGTGKDVLFDNLLKNNIKVMPVPSEYEKHYSFKSRYFVPFPEFALSEHGIHKAFDSIMEKAAKLSVLAAKLALEDAGFELCKHGSSFQINENADCSVIVGVGLCEMGQGSRTMQCPL